MLTSIDITVTNTLTGQFTSYTLLAPGWSPFDFQTAVILCGKNKGA